MSRSKRQSVNENSHFEQNFLVEKAFKRNKRYFDKQKIDNAESKGSMRRRRPRSSSEKSIDEKINSSFMNSTAAFSDKVDMQIGKFKLRMNNANGNDELEFNESGRASGLISYQNETPISGSQSTRSFGKSEQVYKKKIRGMTLDGYCSREQYYQSKIKPIIDERLFNNYTEMQPNKKNTRDFKKYLERDMDFAHKNFNELEYNTQKLYEDYYYKKSTMECNFKYKRNVNSEREFYEPKRKEDEPSTDLCPEKVMKSYEKCSVTGVKNIDSFYMNSGRELPSQLDHRLCNNLTNEWVDKEGKIVKKTKEYNLRRMKNDLIEARLAENTGRKMPTFERQELCDMKYFRLQHTD